MSKVDDNIELFSAFNKIPYSLFTQESGNGSSDLLNDLTEIQKFYKIYHYGSKFQTEGSHGDYAPSQLKFRLSSGLINKQARFLFAETPDVIVEAKGDVGRVSKESQDAITTLNDLVKTVFDENRLENLLVKAAKDCFIGRRVAALVNFNEIDGISISFLPSTQFFHEFHPSNQNVLSRFTAFSVIGDGVGNKDRKIFRKRYVLDDHVVFLEEELFDGAGRSIEVITPRQELSIPFIPAVVFINDGLTGDTKGESEIELLGYLESWYSKLANADNDAQRKSMNVIRYTVDMESNSTKNLSNAPGAFWDLQSDQNLETGHPQIGTIENNMAYSPALKTTLERIKSTAFEQIDMPLFSLESLQGAITSGKSLKAIYWPLLVRCKEKMKTWSPGLRLLTEIVIEGSLIYPDVASMYTSRIIPSVEYEIKVEQNHPLPEDVAEEKTIDLAEVTAQTMSRKTYMKKWRGLTDDEADSELKQIASEKSIIDDHLGLQSEWPQNTDVEDQNIDVGHWA